MEMLISVLEYHVVNGSVVFSTEIEAGSVATLQGSELELSIEDGTVFVDSARVLVPNIILTNGVAHIIDT
jgi:uncharacterized surface protein with fasciclin (FAS1) repeats